MSRIMPPLLLRVGVLERRAVRIARGRLEQHRRADLAGGQLLLGGGVAGVEAAHEAHLEEDAASSRSPPSSRASRPATAPAASRRRSACRAPPRRSPCSRWVLVGLTITTASTSLSSSSVARVRGPARHVELAAATSAAAAASTSATATSRVSGMRVARSRAYTRPSRPRPIKPTPSRLRAVVAHLRAARVLRRRARSAPADRPAGVSPLQELDARSPPPAGPSPRGTARPTRPSSRPRSPCARRRTASKPITRILPVLARGRDRLDRAERHHVVAREHRVDLGVRLQHVLEHGEALVALPVARSARRRSSRRARP